MTLTIDDDVILSSLDKDALERELAAQYQDRAYGYSQEKACADVRRLARRKADDDVHWSCRIGLRPCDPRHGRKGDGPCGQM